MPSGWACFSIHDSVLTMHNYAAMNKDNLARYEE